MFVCNVRLLPLYVFRTCYVPSDSLFRKADFLSCLNSSPSGKSVMCSLQDVQLSDFILQKKRSLGAIPQKHVITTIGRQSNGLWAITPDLTISKDGRIIELDEHDFIWVQSSHPKVGKEVPNIANFPTIHLPLSSSILADLLTNMKIILNHNFYAGLMVMGSCIMALHYDMFLKAYYNCPIPIAFGPSGTGKTTALLCGLATVGSSARFFTSSASNNRPFLLNMCSSSSLPIGIDDPSFQNDIDKLCIDLFNGAKSGCISRGESKPCTTAVISANFRGSEKERLEQT